MTGRSKCVGCGMKRREMKGTSSLNPTGRPENHQSKPQPVLAGSSAVSTKVWAGAPPPVPGTRTSRAHPATPPGSRGPLPRGDPPSCWRGCSCQGWRRTEWLRSSRSRRARACRPSRSASTLPRQPKLRVIPRPLPRHDWESEKESGARSSTMTVPPKAASTHRHRART